MKHRIYISMFTLFGIALFATLITKTTGTAQAIVLLVGLLSLAIIVFVVLFMDFESEPFKPEWVAVLRALAQRRIVLVVDREVISMTDAEYLMFYKMSEKEILNNIKFETRIGFFGQDLGLKILI